MRHYIGKKHGILDKFVKEELSSIRDDPRYKLHLGLLPSIRTDPPAPHLVSSRTVVTTGGGPGQGSPSRSVVSMAYDPHQRQQQTVELHI